MSRGEGEAGNTGRVTRPEPPPTAVRKIGGGSGLVALCLLDLLALEDLTTAGAWMPELAFLIASVPALVALLYVTFGKRRG